MKLLRLGMKALERKNLQGSMVEVSDLSKKYIKKELNTVQILK